MAEPPGSSASPPRQPGVPIAGPDPDIDGAVTSVLRTEDGLDLLVSSLPAGGRGVGAQGQALIVHGYAEHHGRYGELVALLHRMGFSCLLLDLRGHGRSQGSRGHVADFEHYRHDLDLVLEKTGWSRDVPSLLFGHSLGGLIALEYVLHRPGRFDRLVVSSPFLAPAVEVPKLKVALGHLAAKVAPTLNLAGVLDPEMLTHDEEQQRRYRQDPLIFQSFNPKWFLEVRDAQQEVYERAGEIRIPALFLLGASDAVADPQQGRQVFERLGSEAKTLRVYPQFFHEVLNESGRQRVYADVESWLRDSGIADS
ncbi:MAG: alpha/beta hydrolase [Acidobacteriota bacterium]|nr:alpha/beta hydrolase [Acidobacteriota bacterium]